MFWDLITSAISSENQDRILVAHLPVYERFVLYIKLFGYQRLRMHTGVQDNLHTRVIFQSM